MSEEPKPYIVTPTVGRIVHYYPGINETVMCDGKEPLPGIIASVLNNNCVTLGCFDATGTPFGRVDVLLIQAGDEVPENRNISYAVWPARI